MSRSRLPQPDDEPSLEQHLAEFTANEERFSAVYAQAREFGDRMIAWTRETERRVTIVPVDGHMWLDVEGFSKNEDLLKFIYVCLTELRAEMRERLSLEEQQSAYFKKLLQAGALLSDIIRANEKV